MLDKDHQFKRSLLRMLQAGAFEELLECREGQPAAVEFRLQRVYRVHLRRRTVLNTPSRGALRIFPVRRSRMIRLRYADGGATGVHRP